MKINLVENGIFPILYDKNGISLEKQLDTEFSVSGTVQGEGKLLGSPCLFIRTSSCNLRCIWWGLDHQGSLCDTPYSSHKPEKNSWQVEDVVATVKANLGQIKHVVISGGEPTIQTEALVELLHSLRELGLHTTIETNGTLYDPKIAEYTNLISISPKLSTSTPSIEKMESVKMPFNAKWAERHERDRKNIEVIQQYIDSCEDFQLKFVVADPTDIDEIQNDFLSQLTNWKPEDVCLMPEGVTPEDLMQRSHWIVQECIKNGWRFTPRLHALLFGIKRGV